MTPARPMLAEVLAVLTGTEAWRWRDAMRFTNATIRFDPLGVGLFWQDVMLEWQPIAVLDSTGIGADFRAPPPFIPWACPSPAEAWEMLQARDLIPMDYRGSFFCTVCHGVGHIQRATATRRSGVGQPVITRSMCVACAGAGYHAHPQTLPDLVAWVSLGAEAIATAEALGADAHHAVPKSLRYVPPTRAEWWVHSDIHADDLVECCGDGVQLKASGYIFRWRSGSLRKSMRPIAEVAELWGRGFALNAINGRIGLCIPPLTPG